MLGDTFFHRVVNRWNSLDQETVDVGRINSFKGRLDKIRKTMMGFYGSCMVRKALGLMEIGPPWGHTRWITRWVMILTAIARTAWVSLSNHFTCNTSFVIMTITTRECLTETRPDDDAFQIDSSCYKVHKDESVTWFTAINRCLSNNASLAVFDDNVPEYFPSSVLSGQSAWIGLLKSWWIWPALGTLTVDHII